MVGRTAVEVVAGMPARVDVNDDRRQLGLGVEEAMTDFLCQAMAVAGGQAADQQALHRFPAGQAGRGGDLSTMRTPARSSARP